MTSPNHGTDPSPPDHNPEQVVERLRAAAEGKDGAVQLGVGDRRGELEDEANLLRRAANLLDYYASVVEEALKERAESKDSMYAARAGKSDYAAVCQGRAEAFREALQLLEAALPAQPEEEKDG